LKNHADALDRPWPPFWLFLGGVLLNIFLNWVMIYGNLGCPAIGMNGAAWATLISRTAILVAMFFWLVKAQDLRDWVPFRWLRKPVRADLIAHAKIGAPASFQMLCEVGAFSAAGLMMGYFGQVSMAAHQVAITCASTAFMIPLGLAMALTVRTGAVAGSGDSSRLRAVVLSGWLLATGCGVFNALLFFLIGPFLASCFTTDPAVIALTVSLLVIVGIFQLFDCLQVASSSMLRGLHVTRMPAAMVFMAYRAPAFRHRCCAASNGSIPSAGSACCAIRHRSHTNSSMPTIRAALPCAACGLSPAAAITFSAISMKSSRTGRMSDSSMNCAAGSIRRLPPA
jgi:MATE family multidrug resistance protein